jgi:hypothetical protein
MNQSATNKYTKNPDCAGPMNLAERELTAFFRAVTDLFGTEVAELSAKQWLCELEATEALPASTREWRWVTVKASAWLANRMKVLSPSTEFATT